MGVHQHFTGFPDLDIDKENLVEGLGPNKILWQLDRENLSKYFSVHLYFRHW